VVFCRYLLGIISISRYHDIDHHLPVARYRETDRRGTDHAYDIAQTPPDLFWWSAKAHRHRRL